MKKLALVVSLIVVSMLIAMPSMGLIQNSDPTQGGSNNVQNTINNNANYDSHTNEVTVANQNGVGNTQTTITNSVNTNGGSIGATSVSNDQNVAVFLPSKTSNDGLPIYDTPWEITTLYQNEVISIPVVMTSGEQVNLSWVSADPVLVYVVNKNEAPTAENSILIAPVFDVGSKTFDHGGLYTYPTVFMNGGYNDGLSRQNVISFTAKKNGNYSFIVDSRLANSKNAQTQNTITDNTVDVAFQFVTI